MKVRDAVEADAGRLAAIAGTPTDVMRNLIHDRTVKVGEAETEEEARPLEDTKEGDIVGFVSYDAREGTVHVTQADGSRAACVRLLEEPVRFARQEGMNVELLVPEESESVGDAAQEAGFDETGSGPRFGGDPTVRYRMDPS